MRWLHLTGLQLTHGQGCCDLVLHRCTFLPQGFFSEWTSRTSEAQSSETRNRKSPLLERFSCEGRLRISLSQGRAYVTQALLANSHIAQPILALPRLSSSFGGSSRLELGRHVIRTCTHDITTPCILPHTHSKHCVLYLDMHYFLYILQQYVDIYIHIHCFRMYFCWIRFQGLLPYPSLFEKCQARFASDRIRLNGVWISNPVQILTTQSLTAASWLQL